MNSSPQPWAAQRIVDADLARSLIETQFPDLAPVRLEPFGAGWDNTAYLANDRVVFRFPRRAIAAPLLETELRILPRIASRLPIPIPVPRWAGHPEDRYPWPFAGYELLPGRTADRVALSDSQREALAGPLGRFLAVLHALPPDDAGPDTIGRLNVGRLATRIRQSWPHADAPIFEAALKAQPSGRRVLVHGDLYVRHLLVDARGELSGVIDWGDVHCGDPAVDLSVAWSFLPPSARAEFRNAYGPVDDSTWALARLRALHYAGVLTDYGRDIDDPDLTREASTILRFATSD